MSFALLNDPVDVFLTFLPHVFPNEGGWLMYVHSRMYMNSNVISLYLVGINHIKLIVVLLVISSLHRLNNCNLRCRLVLS